MRSRIIPKKKPAAKRENHQAKKPRKKIGALEAAALILKSRKSSMTSAELIEAMAARNLWTSPGGKTPDRTLCSAISREIKLKGKDARFTKAERGKFALAAH